MGELRREEARRALESLGATLTVLSFPDLNLPFVPLQEIVTAVLNVVQEKQPDALFSFHPHEITPEFDHRDHNIAGTVARQVGAAADVDYFSPGARVAPREKQPGVLKERPELYLWTSQNQVTHTGFRTLDLSEEVREKRNEYLIKHYPSQFRDSEKQEWIPIFDSITQEKSGEEIIRHQERYLRVR